MSSATPQVVAEPATEAFADGESTAHDRDEGALRYLGLEPAGAHHVRGRLDHEKGAPLRAPGSEPIEESLLTIRAAVALDEAEALRQLTEHAGDTRVPGPAKDWGQDLTLVRKSGDVGVHAQDLGQERRTGVRAAENEEPVDTGGLAFDPASHQRGKYAPAGELVHVPDG